MHEHEHRVAFLHIHPSEQAQRERESQPEQVLHTHDYYTYRSETPTSHPFLVTFALHISLLIFLFISVLCCCCNFSSCFICTLCCSFLTLHSFYLSQFFVVIWFGVCVFSSHLSVVCCVSSHPSVVFQVWKEAPCVSEKNWTHSIFVGPERKKDTLRNVGELLLLLFRCHTHRVCVHTKMYLWEIFTKIVHPLNVLARRFGVVSCLDVCCGSFYSYFVHDVQKETGVTDRLRSTTQIINGQANRAQRDDST